MFSIIPACVLKKYSTNKMRFILSGLVCLLFTTIHTHAATYYSKASTNFSLTTTWTADTVSNPNAPSVGTTDIYIIRNGHNVTFNAARTVGQIIVRSGGTFTIGGNFTLTTTSPLTINTGGTMNLNTRTLTFVGDCINNGTISGTTGQLSINANNFTNNNIFSVTTGRINLTTGSIDNNGSITLSSGRVILADGTLTNAGSLSFTLTGAQLTKTTGIITNTATGTISATGTATITMGTGDFVNLNSSSAVDFAASNIVIAGTDASQNIGGFITTGRFSSTKTAGTLTITGDITANGFTMNGSGSIMDMGVGLTHTTTGTVILTAGSMDGNSSTINVNIVSTSAWGGSSAAVFDPGTSTVNFNAAGAQTLSASGTKTFYNLTFSNSGIKTNSTTTVTNIFSLEGTATASAAPTYGANATLRYNTANPRTAGVEWITPFAATGGVMIDNTGAITANASKIFNQGSLLTINNGATLTAAANNFTFNGDFVNNGSWTASSGNVVIAGAIGQNIGRFTTTGTVSMTKTNGIAILQGNINGGDFTMNGAGGVLQLGAGLTHTFTGTWTNTAGTLDGNTSVLNVAGAVSGTAITFNSDNGTVNFTGNTAQGIPDFSYHDLGFSGTGIKTLTGTTMVDGVLTINPGSELDLSSFILDFTGGGTPLVNNGTFTASTSTVNYSSALPTVITAVDYYNLNGNGGNRTLNSTGSIGIAGSFTPGSGAYTVDNSTVDFNGNGEQAIPAFIFHNLVVSNAGIKKILASITVACQTIDITDNASVEINADGGGRLDVLQ